MDWESELELGDVISFALDFKKLQRVLRSILSGMEDMKMDITKLQEHQERWEDTLLVKMNALEKQVQQQVQKEDTAHLKFIVEKFQSNYNDEVMTIHTTLNSLREDMANLNSEVIETQQVSNECKAAVFSAKSDTTSKINDLDRRVVDLTTIATTLAHDSKDFATRADLHSSVQTIASRLANTEKSVATEFGGFNSWKEKLEGMWHHSEDKIDSIKGDINMLKTITDELSPPEVKKAITNMSREIAKLRAAVRELSESADARDERLKNLELAPSSLPLISLSSTHSTHPPSTPPPPSTIPSTRIETFSPAGRSADPFLSSPSPRAETPPRLTPTQSVAITQIEALQKEMMDQLADQSKKHYDLRRDVSDLGTLLEALTTGVKGTDQQRQEYSKMLEEHGKQLSNLLRTKADISVVETLLLQPRAPSVSSVLSPPEKEELSAIRELIKSKANKTELAKIRKRLEKGLTVSAHTHGDGHLTANLDSSISRVHFRCLACDRLMAPTPTSQQEGTPPFFDLGPQVAFRRWRVKDIMKDSKNAATNASINGLVTSYSGPPPGSAGTPKRNSLMPITPRGSTRPKSAAGILKTRSPTSTPETGERGESRESRESRERAESRGEDRHEEENGEDEE